MVTVLSLRFTPFSITQIIRFKDRLYFNKVRSVDRNTSVRKTLVIKAFLFEKSYFKDSLNNEIVKATVGFILSTERFNGPLF